MKKFKDFLESKGISQVDFEAKTPAEIAELYNEYNGIQNKALEDLLDKCSTKTEVEEAVAKINLATKELDKQMKLAGTKLTDLESKGSGVQKPQTILDVIVGKKDEISNPFKGKGDLEFSVSKADVLASTAITNNTIGARDNTLSPLASRKLTMYNIFNKITIGRDMGATIKYIDWDDATTARAAAMVAEGGTFPESTARWIEREISLKKIGDSIPVSEEMLVDHARFAGELEKFLKQNVDLVEDAQLLNGTGLTVNIAGLDASATAFTAVASGITDASFYDLVPKVREDISKGKGNKFNGNVVLMNLTEINKYKLKKDANNNYVMPPFYNREGNVIDGATVIENNLIANNICYVGDSSMGTIYEGAEGYSVTVGMVASQFVEDMKTLKARKRLALLIKESEKAGWRKVASISAALTTLAT